MMMSGLFIIEGQAQVLGSVGEENNNCSEFLLKPFDFFGRVDVVAVSQLTCLLEHQTEQEQSFYRLRLSCYENNLTDQLIESDRT
ncbi:hypothetical protein HA466_0070220 [Hirschfeldia incana]|nr:hypothetical protein HA466_0070220 [Hirschfeldia incana]